MDGAAGLCPSHLPLMGRVHLAHAAADASLRAEPVGVHAYTASTDVALLYPR